MLNVNIPREYAEKVNIFRTVRRGERRLLAKNVTMLIVPKTNFFSGLNQQPISLDLDYEFDGVFEKPIKNLTTASLIKRDDGTELTVVRVKKIGNIQKVDLKKQS